MGEMIYWVVATGLGVLSVFYGLLKWTMSIINGRFKDHKKQIDSCFDEISKNEQRVNETRDEMHKEYTHNNSMNTFAQEIREDVNKISTQLDMMNASLNQLIGKIGSHEA